MSSTNVSFGTNVSLLSTKIDIYIVLTTTEQATNTHLPQTKNIVSPRTKVDETKSDNPVFVASSG